MTDVYIRLLDDLLDYLKMYKGRHRPEMVVLSKPYFEEWFYYCEENNMDPTRLEGIEIAIDENIDWCKIMMVVGSTEYGRSKWAKDKFK